MQGSQSRLARNSPHLTITVLWLAWLSMPDKDDLVKQATDVAWGVSRKYYQRKAVV